MIAAFVVRLHWNLRVHPIGDYILSDMRGYDIRSLQVLTTPGRKIEYHAFFPYGTHYLIAGIKWVFGRYNHTAISVVYALMGTMTVGFAYGIAHRVSRFRWLAPLVGLFLIFYFPLISLGGYLLSELPSSFFMLGATYFLVRLAKEGRVSFAWVAGVMAGCGAAVRPQLLMSIAVLGVVWLLGRKHMPKLTLKRVLCAIIPVFIVLGYSSYRHHYHTERYGLISENGTFNMVFGRCHNKGITAHPDGKKHRSRVMFGPPPLIQLLKRDYKNPTSWVKAEPALADKLSYQGYIGDKVILNDFIRECVESTGYLGQIKYSVVNVMLLAAYNTMWPDSGQGMWRHKAGRWGRVNLYLLTFPALIGMFIAFRRKNLDGLGMVAIHLWGMIIVAALYFGGARVRGPYDPLIMILAFEVYGIAGVFLYQQYLKRRGRAPAIAESKPADAASESTPPQAS